MISCEARHCLLQPKKNQHQGFFLGFAKDDNKPEGSSLSFGVFGFFLELQKTTINGEACYCFM
jgi:hypothetical protein